MNKSEFVKYIATKDDISQKEANNIIDTFCNTVIDSMSEGNEINLIGFGSFGITQLKARTGRNPMTGAAMKLKASKLLKFKAGRKLKDAANNKLYYI